MDLSLLVSAAEQTVREAAHIAREYFSSDSPIATMAKPDGSPVTEGDTRIDSFIRERLQAQFPAIPFLSEEGANSPIDESAALWVLDPIDATANFAHSNPHFSISLAYVQSGKTYIGIVCAPVENMFYSSSKDGGAFGNGTAIHTGTISLLQGARILLDSGSHPTTIATHALLKEALEKAGAAVEGRNCASLDMCAVAAGEYDAFIHRGLQAWDIAAAVGIAQEAGAIVSDLQGNPKNLFTPGIIVVNPILHPMLVNLVRDTLD